MSQDKSPGRVVSCAITEAGAALARRLPYELVPGPLLGAVRRHWASADGLVLFAAAGAVVRAVAPLLETKHSDPAVVCVDDRGRFAIALLGGHSKGANALAREVAGILGAEPVVTTASEAAGLPALEDLPGFSACGDLAGVVRRWLDGEPPLLERDGGLASWPLPAALGALEREELPSTSSALEEEAVPPGSEREAVPPGLERAAVPPGLERAAVPPGLEREAVPPGLEGEAQAGSRGRRPARIAVTDSARDPGPREVLLRPRSLVLGVGTSSGAPAESIRSLAEAALAEAGLHPAAVGVVATIDRRQDEPALVALARELGATLRVFPAQELALIGVPNPSAAVRAAVGTPSVAEAAALAASGPMGELVLPKRRCKDATVAIARRARPPGRLAIVGLGPGKPSLRTPAAEAAVRQASLVVGYGPYLDQASDLIGPHQEVVSSEIGAEERRCRLALEEAAAGRDVALVCSGDPGIYAMASLACELAPGAGEPPLEVVPGVTAAQAAAALLGAPLGHDHAVISLSDLLTPWPVIARRLESAAEGDFVVVLYNPRSSRRTTQLAEALAILASRRKPSTPAAVVTQVARPGEQVERTTIDRLDPAGVGMQSIVVVGSSTTRWIGQRMVTPRGYR